MLKGGMDSKFTKKCIWCCDQPIKYRLNMLCGYCGRSFAQDNILPTNLFVKRGRKKLTRTEKIENLKTRHGDEIITDLEGLKVNPFLTLDAVGKKYDLSRERIRQLYNFYHYPHKYKKAFLQKSKEYKEMVSGDIACKNDPRHKLAEYKVGSTHRQGAKIEKLFFDRCVDLGIDVEIPCKQTVDFKINGYGVEVKSRSGSTLLPGAKTPHYSFTIHKRQMNEADFFACYHNKTKSFFIIPKHAISTRGNITILREKSDYPIAKNKYWEYKYAWHLLQD